MTDTRGYVTVQRVTRFVDILMKMVTDPFEIQMEIVLEYVQGNKSPNKWPTGRRRYRAAAPEPKRYAQ